MTKVSVEKVELEQYEVEFPLEEVREMLRFEHNGTKMRLPYNAIMTYRGASPETGGPVLIASFQLDVTSPEPSGLTQQEIDIWGLIRAAGGKGITYHKLHTLKKSKIHIQTIMKVVRSLVERNLVEECPEKQARKGAPPRKLWRSVE